MHSSPADERFFAKVDKTSTCWLWTAATCSRGYGRFKVRSYTLVAAHRWAYEHLVGPIPKGLTIDHLCRVPACVNPAHLEPVTQAVNNARKPRITHCLDGHEYTPANTYPRGITGRECKTCACLRARKKRRRRAALRALQVALPDA